MSQLSQIQANLVGTMAAKSTVRFLRSHRSSWLYLSLLGMAIPHVILEVILGALGANYTDDLKSTFAQDGRLTGWQLLENVASFSTVYLGCNFLIFLWLSSVYLYLVRWAFVTSQGGDPPAFRKSILGDLFLMARKGFPVGFLILLILAVFNKFFLVFFILVSLSFMAPALLVVDRERGIFQTVMDLFTLKFSKGVVGTRWVLFFQMVSYGALGLSAMVLVLVTGDYIPWFDRFLPVERGIFTPMLSDLPFSAPHMAGLLYKAVFASLVCGIFAVFSSFYVSYASLGAPSDR